MLWYRDILRGLCHLHSFRIWHLDLRPDNTLLRPECHSRAILCDFSKAGHFGELNTIPHAAEPVPRTGLAKNVTGGKDRFAMAYLIFEMERGSKPALSATLDGPVILPHVDMGDSGLNSIITKAWLGQYASTSDILAETDALVEHEGDDSQPGGPMSPHDVRLQHVEQWRRGRLDRYGKLSMNLLTCRLTFKERSSTA